jgi:hypothetical protein
MDETQIDQSKFVEFCRSLGLNGEFAKSISDQPQRLTQLFYWLNLSCKKCRIHSMHDIDQAGIHRVLINYNLHTDADRCLLRIINFMKTNSFRGTMYCRINNAEQVWEMHDGYDALAYNLNGLLLIDTLRAIATDNLQTIDRDNALIIHGLMRSYLANETKELISGNTDRIIKILKEEGDRLTTNWFNVALECYTKRGMYDTLNLISNIYHQYHARLDTNLKQAIAQRMIAHKDIISIELNQLCPRFCPDVQNIIHTYLFPTKI